MQTELVIFMVMISVFVFGTFLLKIPSGVSMLAAAVLAAPLSGNGLPLRHFVEGTFVFLDTNLIIATSTIFMKFIQESGTLEGLNSAIIKRFGNNRVLLLLFLMLVIMFPGMITGAYTTAVIVAASMVAPVLAEMGIPKVEITAIIALGSTLGMIAPGQYSGNVDGRRDRHALCWVRGAIIIAYLALSDILNAILEFKACKPKGNRFKRRFLQ